MRRPPLPTPRQRSHALARVAGAAGVAVFVAGVAALAACRDDAGAPVALAAAGTSTAASTPTVQRPVVADVPPPPQIQGVMTTPVNAPAPSGSASAAALASTRSQLESLLAGAAACTSDSECRTVATGGKACGGPTAYRAYSDKGPGASGIPDLAQKERDLSMAEARASHRVSACFMLADPGGHCEAKTCQTGPAASVK